MRQNNVFCRFPRIFNLKRVETLLGSLMLHWLKNKRRHTVLNIVRTKINEEAKNKWPLINWVWCLNGSLTTGNGPPTLWLAHPFTLYDDFNSSHLPTPPSPINRTTMTRHQVLTVYSLPRHTNKHILKCIFSRSLTHN